MNILFYGSDRLHSRICNQRSGKNWTLHRVRKPDDVLDFLGTHEFQAAVIGACPANAEALEVARLSKYQLRIPAVIALSHRRDAPLFGGRIPVGADVILSDCGDDRLTKLQCDAFARFANEISAKDITSGDLCFHTSRDSFSVNGRDIHLPRKQHQLLELLFLKGGRTVTTDAALNHLYGWETPPNAKIIDVFVCHIRRRLREAGLAGDCIQTIWGQGYSVRIDRSEAGRMVA